MFKKRRQRSISLHAGKSGERAYAVGDVHGCVDLLQALLRKIELHFAQSAPKPAHLIFLGDLIDRGPASKDVIELLINRDHGQLMPHYIMGNHEESLLRGLSGESSLLEPWLRHGGYKTAESYGADRSLLIGRPAHELEHILRSAIPSSHLDFLATFVDSIKFGDVLFVHAGIRPGVSLDEQSSRDMRWIRKDFLESETDFGCLVVHGHTITETIQEKPNRIGLDTGAYSTGVLSAIWIDGEEHGQLQTKMPPKTYR